MSDPYVLGQSRDNNRHYKNYRRTKFFAKFLVFVIVVSAGYIAFDIWRGRKHVQPVVSKTQKIEVVASSEVYNTDFFQFSAEKDWRLDEKTSTKTKYIYRKYRGELIEHELDIYVNDKQQQFEATHVLPVGIDGETNKLLAGPVSEHCKVTFPPKGGNRDPAVVKLANTSLLCNPEDIRYRLVVGQVNSGNVLKLKRANGEVATYMITYQDLTFNNSGMDMSKIINSFEAK